MRVLKLYHGGKKRAAGGGEGVGLGGGDMRRRRLLVIVNPVSGVKRAKQTYDSTVQPMLGQAHIYHELLGA